MTWQDDIKFNRAIKQVMTHEGGFVDHPDDPGGATNFGVSLRYLRDAGHDLGDIDGDGDIDYQDIKALTPARAKAIYYDRFWMPNYYANMPPIVAGKMLDLAVVMGPSQANKLLQRALSVIEDDFGQSVDLRDDGRIGPATLAAISDRARSEARWATRVALRASSEMFFRWLATHRPSSKVFLAGWVARSRW